ncbi:MAG: hypothetical protein RLZZ254_239 [Actinomycetota bacterium]
MKSTDPRMVNVLSRRDEKSGPEAEIGRDLVKRGLMGAPLFIAFGAIGWGVNGALSAGYALALIIANFFLAAAIVTVAARISYAVLMGATLFGYLVRLGLITLAVYLVADASWVEIIPLSITIVVAHLGLLVWELRYVSLSLAFPGVKPKKSDLISSTNGS